MKLEATRIEEKIVVRTLKLAFANTMEWRRENMSLVSSITNLIP